MPQTRLINLFDRYLAKTCSDAEKQELAELILSSENDETVRELLEKAWVNAEGELDMPEYRANEILYSILNKETSPVRRMADMTTSPGSASHPLPERIGTGKRGIWRRWAVAASIVLIVGLGGYLLFFNKSGKQPEIVGKEQTHDVAAPTTARATLKLDDGSIVYLDSVGNGQLAIQGNVSVVKGADGKLLYEIASSQAPRNDEIKYNTISNPRGSKVQTLTLIDGTQVWLNAESSITYPIAFVGNERKVTMTGEAYFEVSHVTSPGLKATPSRGGYVPFFVEANGVTTEVLGTHFNVNSYYDEGSIKVTLLEGSVKVSRSDKSNESVMIKPGEQAIVAKNSELRVNSGVDVEAVLAWKNGYFQFERASIQDVMKQFARWYNVEVSYEGKISEREFGGKISRSASAAEAMKVLQESKVNFRIEGRKIVIMP